MYKQLVAIFFFFLFALSSKGQDCSILQNNTFKVPSRFKTVVVKFDGSSYYEYHDTNRYIKAHIQWVSDCEYYLLIQKNTLPDLPFVAGDKLHFVIDKIKRNKVYYTATFNDRTWQGKMIKIKPKL